jgi:hypothetical protein
MAKKRVGVLEAHEAPGSIDPQIFCGRAIAERLLAGREARQIGKRLIQMVRGNARDAMTRRIEAETEKLFFYYDGPLGRGNVLPFSRATNPMLAPQKLHYEMPMAGDRSIFARHRRSLIKASPLGRTGRAVLAAMQVRAAALNAAIGRTALAG